MFVYIHTLYMCTSHIYMYTCVYNGINVCTDIHIKEDNAGLEVICPFIEALWAFYFSSQNGGIIAHL